MQIRISILLMLLAIACALLVATHATALAQQSPLSVSGQVVNGTPDSGSVVGLAVILHMQGADSYDNMETTTDDDGQFRFDGIVYDPALIYGVSVRHQDALYGTEVSLAERNAASGNY